MNSSHSSFVLRCFGELRRERGVLVLPFSCSYLLVLLGNVLLVQVVCRVGALHTPMHLLICALCVVDVLLVSCILPRMLLALLLDWDGVTLAGCLTQMFFTHFLSSVESTLLLAMALDRYVAICHPLHYKHIVDGWAWPKLLLFTLLRSSSIMAVLVAFAGSHRFCSSNAIQHCYCDHMALVSLACDDTQHSSAAGLAVIACFVGVDIPLIFFSYVQILRVVLQAAGGGERWKAFHTCGTHLMVIMCFYLVGSISFLSHNLSVTVPPDANTMMGLTYILLPATVNPIIYGIRTKDIRSAILKMFRTHPQKGLSLKVRPAATGHTHIP